MEQGSKFEVLPPIAGIASSCSWVNFEQGQIENPTSGGVSGRALTKCCTSNTQIHMWTSGVGVELCRTYGLTKWEEELLSWNDVPQEPVKEPEL